MQTIQVLSALFKVLKIHFSKLKGKLYLFITCLCSAGTMPVIRPLLPLPVVHYYHYQKYFRQHNFQGY